MFNAAFLITILDYIIEIISFYFKNLMTVRGCFHGSSLSVQINARQKENNIMGGGEGA